MSFQADEEEARDTFDPEPPAVALGTSKAVAVG